MFHKQSDNGSRCNNRDKVSSNYINNYGLEKKLIFITVSFINSLILFQCPLFFVPVDFLLSQALSQACTSFLTG